MNYMKVALGIILRKNKVYITKTSKTKYKKDIWEFPGGKIKKSENIISGLKREIIEEVGIKILTFNFFQYQNIFYKRTKLYFFLISQFKGNAHSKEGYKYIWISLDKLNFCQFPKFNFHVIKKLKKLIKY